jgi:hypothetical protein
LAGDRFNIEDFLDAYRVAFEAFDTSAIADLFSYPCLITSDAAEISVTTIQSREAWVPQLEQLLAAYRAIGIRSAEILGFQVVELTPRLAQAIVRWGLVGQAGTRIYEFQASYTLVDLRPGMRIAAIAHNETPRLRAALEHERSRETGR